MRTLKRVGGIVCRCSQLRDFFALKVDGGHSAIDSVRVVRDKGTQRGKGFGFVTFKVCRRIQALPPSTDWWPTHSSEC